MNEHRIFFTAIFTDELQLPYNDLVNYVKRTKETNNSTNMSNVGGWQSSYYSIFDMEPPMTMVHDAVVSKATHVFQKYNIARNAKLTNYWFNINKKYNYNAPHSHLRTTLSAVLYLKVPSNSGDLVIHNPAPQFSGFPDAPNQYNTSLYKLTPTVGKLVMFSSDIVHSVSQNLTEDEDDERISIAFDFD